MEADVSEGYAALAHGFLLNFGLLLAIGPQSAFVLSHGLTRRHVLPIASTCLLCDTVLIGMGVLGIGAALADHTPLHTTIAAVGALFLTGYGAFAARSAVLPAAAVMPGGRIAPGGRPQAVAGTLAVTLLNPLVYIDALLLLGGTSSHHADAARPWFLAGALMASGLWFFALGYGAAIVEPLFRRPSAWRALNAVVAAIMWSAGWSLWRTLAAAY